MNHVRHFALILLAALAPSALAQDVPSEERPTMRQLVASGTLEKPPTQRELVDARRTLKARFREPLSHVQTSAGAMQAVEILLEASAAEPDRSLKWLMLDEARRLGASAGHAEAVTRAITIASAPYAFDELEMEIRSLAEIPLRALDSRRATVLAEVAESLATRAETDGRLDKAVAAQMLSLRAWQRTGNAAASRRAAVRHDELEIARVQK